MKSLISLVFTCIVVSALGNEQSLSNSEREIVEKILGQYEATVECKLNDRLIEKGDTVVLGLHGGFSGRANLLTFNERFPTFDIGKSSNNSRYRQISYNETTGTTEIVIVTDTQNKMYVNSIMRLKLNNDGMLAYYTRVSPSYTTSFSVNNTGELCLLKKR